jgi:hypothetical protein
MNILKCFSVMEMDTVINMYIANFAEFRADMSLSYTSFINQITINYKYTLRRISNYISTLKYYKQFIYNTFYKKNYIKKLDLIKSDKIILYLNKYFLDNN